MRTRLWTNRYPIGLVVVAVCIFALIIITMQSGNQPLTTPTTAPTSSTTGQPVPQSDTKQPNIIVIVADDQSNGFMWTMPKTQALIADKGLTLTNYIIPTSACCPSRASLLTGLFAHNTGVWTNESKYGAWKHYKANGNEEQSLPVWLQNAGYRTGLFGKYMNGYNIDTAGGYKPPGWNEWITFSAHKGPTGAYYNYYLTDGTTHTNGPDDYSTDVLSRRMNAFITTTPPTQPVFAYYAPYAPHAPQTPSSKYAGTYTGKTPTSYSPDRNPQDVTNRPAWIQKYKAFTPTQLKTMDANWTRAAETLLSIDDAVEATITTLTNTGRIDNTLIVYVSDNGYMWGAHRVAHKNVPYDAATRVPAFIRWDGHVIPTSATDSIIANVDITATILDAAGITPTRPIDGRTVFADKPPRIGVVLESGPVTERPSYCGYRTKKYLFVRWASGEEELYNYALDPYEQDNLAYNPADRTTVRTLRTQARHACTPLPPEFHWGKRAPITQLDSNQPLLDSVNQINEDILGAAG